MRYCFIFILYFLISAVSCTDSSTSGQEPPPEPGSFTVEVAFPNLSFNNPLDLQRPGDSSGRLFVVEQGGMIKVFNNDSTTASSSVFLDISDRVVSGGEEGLLGLAFDPDFASNGFFYVDYTAPNPLRTVISRFKVSGDNPNRANKTSETSILSFKQPFSNHNGGQIRFGPDGFLYIATGDGGSGGDPQGNAQNRGNLLGNILRIDVEKASAGKNFSIPPDNPFAGNNKGFREEIFAYGLRNPFRFSFDAKTGKLWAGDVGQNRFEEIDIIENGNNYGWNTVEGKECFRAQSCDRSGFTPPQFVYDHSVGQSITGGFIYRGPILNTLSGRYIYADFISGRIWAFDPGSKDHTLVVNSNLSIASFGVDAKNKLYLCAFDGNIYRLIKTN